MIEAAVEQNLVRARIVAAKLPPPATQAPTDLRFLQFAAEIFGVQVVEKLCQVEMPALRSRVARANTTKTHAVHAVAGAAGTRVFEIRRSEEHTSELQSRFDLVC